MATSAMDPNRGAAAPYESTTAGAGWLGSRSLQLIPLIGEPKWHPSKKLEMAEHRPWVAATRGGNTTTNRRSAMAEEGGVAEEM